MGQGTQQHTRNFLLSAHWVSCTLDCVGDQAKPCLQGWAPGEAPDGQLYTNDKHEINDKWAISQEFPRNLSAPSASW